MPSGKNVYVAGAGVSPLPSGNDENKTTAALISAATKALLDAGVTYDDVAHGVQAKKSRYASKAFKAFNEGGIKVDEVENPFETSFSLVGEKNTPCVLVIVEEEKNAIAFVLVSENFLWSRPFLKDSAALIRKAGGDSQGKSKQSLHDICRAVWALRGWSDKDDTSGKKDDKRSWRGYELSRADGQSIPKWKDIEHRQDGKHRLGYNPARETKDISRYLFEGVRAEGKKKASDSIQFERKGGDRVALAKL